MKPELLIEDWHQYINESGFNTVSFIFLGKSRIKHKVVITGTEYGSKYNNWDDESDDLTDTEYNALEEFINVSCSFTHNFYH